jgi:hypothetical protein
VVPPSMRGPCAISARLSPIAKGAPYFGNLVLTLSDDDGKPIAGHVDTSWAGTRRYYPSRAKVSGRSPRAEGREVRRVRTCSDCGWAKVLDDFLPIKGTPYVYGRCRVCRNERARAWYYSSPTVRTAEIARALKNKRRRAAAP